MSDELKNKYTKAFDTIINKHIKDKPNTVFVLVGISPYIHLENYVDNITDQATFDKEGNLDLFTLNWFVNVLQKLTSASTYQILSHQQYASISEYLSVNDIEDRIVVVYDNLRSLYPIKGAEYIEKADANGTEKRPDGMPVYQAEQEPELSVPGQFLSEENQFRSLSCPDGWDGRYQFPPGTDLSVFEAGAPRASGAVGRQSE